MKTADCAVLAIDPKSPPFLDILPPFVNLITQLDGQGRPHSYARNWQGLHVPIETLTPQDLRRALEESRRL